jgi:hypothetical protein
VSPGFPESKELKMNPSPLMISRPRFQPQRLLLAVTLGGALLSGMMSVAFAGGTAGGTAADVPAASRNGPVTRAQVEQDLAAYQASGLAALERDESQSQIGTQPWREARRRYLALRGLPMAQMQALSRADVLKDLKAYRDSGLADAERRDGEESNQSASLLAAQERYDQLTMMDMMDKPLSRAEVLADLQIYRESGLAAFDRSEGEPSANTADHQAARARYEALKRDGRYQTLVMALGHQG